MGTISSRDFLLHGYIAGSSLSLSLLSLLSFFNSVFFYISQFISFMPFYQYICFVSLSLILFNISCLFYHSLFISFIPFHHSAYFFSLSFCLALSFFLSSLSLSPSPSLFLSFSISFFSGFYIPVGDVRGSERIDERKRFHKSKHHTLPPSFPQARRLKKYICVLCSSCVCTLTNAHTRTHTHIHTHGLMDLRTYAAFACSARYRYGSMPSNIEPGPKQNKRFCLKMNTHTHIHWHRHSATKFNFIFFDFDAVRAISSVSKYSFFSENANSDSNKQTNTQTDNSVRSWTHTC